MNLSPSFRAVLVSGLVVAVALPAGARELSLADALRLAAERNERVAIAAQQLAQAQIRLRASWARLLPALTVGGRYRLNDREVVRNAGTPAELSIQKRTGTTGNVEARLSLFNVDTVPDIVTAKAEVQVESAAQELERRELQFAVVEAYLAAAIAQSAVRAAERSVETAHEIHRITEARVSVGAALPIDRMRSELALKRAESMVIDARTVLVDARAFLQFLTVEEEPPETRESPQAIAAQLDLDREAQRRPDLAVLDRTVELRRVAADWDWTAWAPELALSGNYQLTSDGGFSGQTERWWVDLTVRWDLFQPGERWRDASLNASQARQAELELQLGERRATYESLAARERLASARAALATTESRLALARETRRHVLKAYEAGRAGALDLVEAEDTLQTAEIELTADRLALAQTQVRLLRAVGLEPLPQENP